MTCTLKRKVELTIDLEEIEAFLLRNMLEDPIPTVNNVEHSRYEAARIKLYEAMCEAYRSFQV